MQTIAKIPIIKTFYQIDALFQNSFQGDLANLQNKQKSI